MPIVIEDFETEIATRLAQNNAELSALAATNSQPTLKRIYELSPSFAQGLAEVPAAMVIPRQMTEPIPNTAPGGSAGRIVVERIWQIDYPIAPSEGLQDTANIGYEGLQLVLPWFATLRNYWLSHPRLETTGGLVTTPVAIPTQPPLSALTRDVFYQDGGMALITVPGGAKYFGIQYTLNIASHGQVRRVS